MALAQIFAVFGVRVTVLEEDLRILDPADEEIAHMLEARMLRQGVARVPDAHVSRAGHAGGGAFVQYRNQAGGAHQAYGVYVLQVVRHEARTDGLGLEHTAVRYDCHGIDVNHALETDEPGLYAVGNGILPAHVRAQQARSLRRSHAIFWDSPRAFRIRQRTAR